MITDFLKGVIVPILTPLDAEEKIDEAKLRQMVNFVIEGGVSGILAFGSNGEFYCIEEDETARGLLIILDETRKRVPVYCGIGAIQTKKCIRIAKMAAEAGADGISVLQPMFIKPNYDELRLHFLSIAEAVPDMPMLLYNNPGRAGYSISAKLVQDLAQTVKNIVGIKDSSGDMTLTCEYIRLTRSLDFKVFNGKDTLIYGALAVGAAGCVATMANMFPRLVCTVYSEYMKRHNKESLEAQYRLTSIRMTMDQASFPVGTKDLANLMGLEVGAPYRPNLPSRDEILELMRKEIKSAGFSI
jgi:4-hydroxy-tetrahydrodipicolinate synthase